MKAPTALPAALLAVAALLASVSGPAAAQSERAIGEAETRGSAPGVALEVADFTGAISPDGSFRLRLRVANRGRATEERLRVVATFHRRAFHRLDFAQAVDEGRVGDVYTSLNEELAPLEGRKVRTIELRRSAEELGFGRGEDTQGVYPLVIRLQREDDTIQTVRTAVVVVASEVAQPVRAALVAPLDAPPALLPEGLLRPDALRQDLAPRGRLRALLTDLGERPDVPVTFAVDARMLDDVADFADGYRALRPDGPAEFGADASLARAARGFLGELRQILPQPHVETVALPYGPADLAALVRGGMEQEATRLIGEGISRVEGHTGARPSRGVLVPPDHMSPGALSQAVSAAMETLVLSDEALQQQDASSTASPVPVRRVRTQAGTTVQAAVPDPWLSELLADEQALEALDRPVAVQRVIAETAAVYFERPFAEQPRGLLLLAPLRWAPPQGFAAGLAGALKAAPWLQPVTLSGLLEEVEASQDSTATVDYPAEARARELSAGYIAQLRTARRALGSLAGVLAEDTATPGRYDRMLLAAASTWYRGDPADGLALVREVMRTVTELYDAVHVADSPTVLLSGVEGQIPVTIENRSPISLRLAVRLDTQRFAFEGGPSRLVVLEPGETRTVAFRARDRSPGGTSPIRVVVADADGQLRLAEGTLVIRSTAVSAAALAVVIGAALFLLLWWLRTFRRRRAGGAAPPRADSDVA